MEQQEYAAIFYKLVTERLALEARRAEVETTLAEIATQIARLQETLDGIAPLAGLSFYEESISKLGLTEAARRILELQKEDWLSVGDIKTKLTDLGYDLSKYSAPDASIHTTLRRLVEAERAESKKEEWRIFYKFKQTDADLPF
jgi:hypothetical protein